jgi:hypothetical protein
LEEIGVNEIIILKLIFKKWEERHGLGRNRWWELVNAVMNLRV